MSLSLADLALRAATVAMLLVLAVSLFRDFRKVVAGRLATAFALGSAVHAAVCTIGAPLAASASHVPLIAISTGNVVVFWLFCRALFDDGFTLRWRHGLIWLLVASLSFINCMWVAPAGNARLSIAMINLVALGFILLAVAQTVASWSADLVEGRRNLRIFIVVAAALYGGLNAILQLLALSGEAAEFAIANSGPGVPPEIVHRVFDRFFRGDPAHGTGIEGCGLGLSIAQWIVSAHDGSIRMESEPAKLTTVTVRLPAAG